MNSAAVRRWFWTHRAMRLASVAAYPAAVLAFVVLEAPTSIGVFALFLALGGVTTWWLLNARCPKCGAMFSASPSFGFWPAPSSFRAHCVSCGASAENQRHVA
jgi:hypothetical protein